MNEKKYEFASCCSIEFFGMFEKRFKYRANTEHNFMLLNNSEWGLWIIWWLSNAKHKSPSSGRLAQKLSVWLLHIFYYFSFDLPRRLTQQLMSWKSKSIHGKKLNRRFEFRGKNWYLHYYLLHEMPCISFNLNIISSRIRLALSSDDSQVNYNTISLKSLVVFEVGTRRRS